MAPLPDKTKYLPLSAPGGGEIGIGSLSVDGERLLRAFGSCGFTAARAEGAEGGDEGIAR